MTNLSPKRIEAWLQQNDTRNDVETYMVGSDVIERCITAEAEREQLRAALDRIIDANYYTGGIAENAVRPVASAAEKQEPEHSDPHAYINNS